MGLGPLRLRFRSGDPIIIRGVLRGPAAEVQVRLLLDTGATWSLINPQILGIAGIDVRGARSSRPITTVSGIAHTAVVEVLGLTILGVHRPDFQVVAHALPPSAPIDGLLGLDFLVGLRLTLDMRVGELTVES